MLAEMSSSGGGGGRMWEGMGMPSFLLAYVIQLSSLEVCDGELAGETFM